MDAILNHGYVSPSRVRGATTSRRGFVAGVTQASRAPFALDDEPVEAKEHLGGWEWDAPGETASDEDFDPRFDEFPDLPRRRTFPNHPAMKSELAGGLCPPIDQIGGHEIVAHHIERRVRSVAAQGVPNYQPNPSGPAAYEPERRTDAHGEGDVNYASQNAQWQTTSQAMYTPAPPPMRRTGKRMASPASGQFSSVNNIFDADLHALGRHRGFGPKPAPLASRSDILHRNVDIRGGCGTETLPFVPGYGGYVPETQTNFEEAARRNLAKRMPKELLVENFNPRMSGCTKANARPF